MSALSSVLLLWFVFLFVFLVVFFFISMTEAVIYGNRRMDGRNNRRWFITALLCMCIWCPDKRERNRHLRLISRNAKIALRLTKCGKLWVIAMCQIDQDLARIGLNSMVQNAQAHNDHVLRWDARKLQHANTEEMTFSSYGA